MDDQAHSVIATCKTAAFEGSQLTAYFSPVLALWLSTTEAQPG
jgi:hypothetical protein